MSEPSIETLSCGCMLRTDEERGLLFFTPCTQAHRALAQRIRKPKSRLIVCRPTISHVEEADHPVYKDGES